MSRRLLHVCLVVLATIVVIACGDDEPTTTSADEVVVTGVVTSVQGDLTSVDSFTIRLGDGSQLSLVPVEGLLFEGTSPLSHLNEHRLNGAPVSVTYVASGNEPYVCTSVGDAGADDHPDE